MPGTPPKDVVDASELLAVTFFDVSIDRMVDAIRDYFCEGEKSSKYKVNTDKMDLGRASLGRPQAGGCHPAVAMVYQPRAYKGRSVFAANLSDGWHTCVNVLSKKLSADCLSIRTSNAEAKYPINDVRIYCRGEAIRHLRAFKDGARWEFFEKGKRLAIESSANYERRRIKDRLSRESLIETVRAAGWDIRDPGLWESDEPAVYIKEVR